MSTYTAETIWRRGEASEADFLARRYSRRHLLRFDGGAEVAGSPSPHNVPAPYSDAAAVDPEEAFVSALSSCHMLFFLDFSARRGFVVDRYADVARGELAKDGAGRMSMTVVTLCPEVAFGGDKLPGADEIARLHHDAHEACFIANSVRTEVRVERAAAMSVAIVGAGIGGLTLALALHRAGIACRVYESAAEILPLGVGINILPHASAELAGLGVLDELERVAVVTREAAFYNRFGQLVYAEPAGRWAGHAAPQLSIHRGDLQGVLLAAVRQRLGDDSVRTGHACTGVDGIDGDRDDNDDGHGHRDGPVRLRFRGPDGRPLPDVEAAVVVACDGIHSAVRRQLYPDEGAPRWSGVNMWRGVTSHAAFLGGATMVRAGWLSVGKMVIYPIRNEAGGRQLVNWVAELEAAAPVQRDWNARGRLDDFFPAFADWRFDWLDVAGLIRQTETVLAYPMVDQDPLPRWSFGRVTLLGDAAHPMVPRGSNGAGQAILDATFLAGQLAERGLGQEALAEYDRVRNAATARVVLTNRSNPPDAILREVHERSGDKPFARIEDVVSREALAKIADDYKRVAGLKTLEGHRP